MIEKEEQRRHDLEERTLAFSKRAVKFCRALPKTVIDAEMVKQLMRSCTSVGANCMRLSQKVKISFFFLSEPLCYSSVNFLMSVANKLCVTNYYTDPPRRTQSF